MSKIITVGREFGSGGREVAKRLAEQLGIAYYDNEVITEIVRHSNLAEEYVKQILERRIVSYFPITIGHAFSTVAYPQMEMENRVFTAQCTAIKEMAEKTDCVIVGRCADYILAEQKPLRLFVYADMPFKMERCRKKDSTQQELTDTKLRRDIRGVDRGRARYYEFFTGQKWGDRENYDLCINTSYLPIKEIVNSLVPLCKTFLEKE